jgi:hypothetical protein
MKLNPPAHREKLRIMYDIFRAFDSSFMHRAGRAKTGAALVN